MSADEKKEPTIINGPKVSSDIKTVLVGCGGTGCNLIVEDVVKKVHRKIAIGSEPDILHGIKDAEKIEVDSRRVQKDAMNLERVCWCRQGTRPRDRLQQ